MKRSKSKKDNDRIEEINEKRDKKSKGLKKRDKSKSSNADPFEHGTSSSDIHRELSKTNKLQILAIFVCAAAIVVILIVVLVSVLSSKGEGYAEDAADNIGRSVDVLNDSDEVHYKDESDYYGVNSAISFDYVFESEDDITADGISYPEWAVFLTMSDDEFITDVVYTDFTVIKKDMRGQRRDSVVNLDSYSKGAKRSTVLKSVNLDPYSITYSQSGIVSYCFKYYYERDNGDEQAAITRVAFSEDGEYQYYTTELLIPTNM